MGYSSFDNLSFPSSVVLYDHIGAVALERRKSLADAYRGHKANLKQATEHLSQGGREFATRSLVGERSRCFGKGGITQRVTTIMLARPNDHCNFRGGWGLSLQTWVAPAGSTPAIADSLY